MRSSCRSPTSALHGPTSFSEAFNFSAILETIGKIGWINYIVALILVSLVVGIPIFVLVFGFIIVAIMIGGVSMVLLKE